MIIFYYSALSSLYLHTRWIELRVISRSGCSSIHGRIGTLGCRINGRRIVLKRVVVRSLHRLVMHSSCLLGVGTSGRLLGRHTAQVAGIGRGRLCRVLGRKLRMHGIGIVAHLLEVRVRHQRTWSEQISSSTLLLLLLLLLGNTSSWSSPSGSPLGVGGGSLLLVLKY